MTRTTYPLLSALVDVRPPTLSPAQWRALLVQARLCKLEGRLAVRAQERGWHAAMPAGVRTHLENVSRTVHRKHQDTRWEADRLVAALRDVQQPVVLLKGAAYVVAGLPAAKGRDFSDVDILVRRSRLREVELELLTHGWVAEALDPYDERYYRDWSHELPPMTHVERMTHLDVHHTLTQPTSRYAIDVARIWPECQPVPGYPGLAVLGPADRVLHSAVHLMQEGEFDAGLRDIVDLASLIEHEAADAAFWPALVQRAIDMGLAVPLHDAVTLAHQLVGMALPAAPLHALAEAAGAGTRRRFIVALLRRALTHQLQPRPRVGDSAVALFLYMRSHLLRMPLHQLAAHLLRKAWMRWRRRGQAAEVAAPGGLLAGP